MIDYMSLDASKHQWHFLYLLLPFIGGIYIADNRNFADSWPIFIILFSIAILLSLWLKNSRQIFILMLFFCLGYTIKFQQKKEINAFRKITFTEMQTGIYFIQSVQQKNTTIKCYGVFIFKKNNQTKFLPLIAYFENKNKILLDNYYSIQCKPRLIKNATYLGAFNQERFEQQKGYTHIAFIKQSIKLPIKPLKISFLEKSLRDFKKYLHDIYISSLNPDAASLSRALVLAERDGIDERLRSYFQATGSMHILAVSGMHIGLLILVLLRVFSMFSFWLQRRYAIAMILVLAWYYAFLTGFSASVVRSVFMFSILSLSHITGKNQDNLTALFFSAFCLLLYDPNFLFDIGFQLSYCAMFGITLYFEPILNFVEFPISWLQKIWQGTALSLAATISTFPLCLYYFHLYPNYAIFANICLTSIASIVLIQSMSFPILSFIPYLAAIGSFLFEKSIELMLTIMHFFTELPGSMARGFNVSFGWVISFWIFIYLWFYTPLKIHRSWLKAAFIGLLVCMIHFKQIEFYKNQVYFFRKEKILVYKIGSHAFLFGAAPKQKHHYLTDNIRNIYNCQIKYFEIEMGQSHFKSHNISIEFKRTRNLYIQVKAKNQAEKIHVY